MNRIYDFKEQLELGKQGEERVFSYLNNQQETVMVLDISDHKQFQFLGIDGMLITESEGLPYNAEFFDVKTDFKYYQSGKLFIEIYADVATHKEGGILSTKAQVFYYYDPFGGELFKVPIYAVKNWYEREGISMDHKSVTNNFGQKTTGVVVTPENLDQAGVPITRTKIGALNLL